jgi:hypothetical protein
MAPRSYDPNERAQEKQASRDDDQRALDSGAKSREDLRQENGSFAFPYVRVNLAGAGSLV